MLCQFTVKNYKSIRDEITFDMQAAAISEHEDSVIKDVDGELFLPISVIYGPNGGGKSNVLEALHILASKVLRPLCATCDKNDCDYKVRKIPVEPFAFSEDSRNEPTEFEVFFRTGIAEYRYVLQIKQDVVIYESLDRIKMETGRRSALFMRNSKEVNLKGDFGKFKISDELSATLANSEKIKDLVLDMIREMDLDIEDFRIEDKDNDRIEVYTKHIVNGYSAEITLSEESSGTKKLFGLLPFIAKSLVYGTTLVIDELDAKIHPILLKNIIERFTNLNINRKGGQLIFTSHDLSTMNSELFRRDEIWFVAKGNAQNSKLYSLVEFKTEKGVSVRKDAKFDKQYLEGRYGADPYLRKIIDWGLVNA